MKAKESIFLVSGLVPNRKSHPLIHRWFGMRFRDHEFEEALDLDDVIRITELGERTLANPGGDVDVAPLADLLPVVVAKAREMMTGAGKSTDFSMNTWNGLRRP